jgi:antitoxin VapB
LRRKAEAVARVDATFIAATRPGRTLGEIFQRAMTAYAETGFPEEWRLHHQGGLAGYEPREYIATPTSPEVVRAHQAFAWNPSITGTKSEDTIIVKEEGYEVITAVGGWPQIPLQVEGQLIARPVILEIS